MNGTPRTQDNGLAQQLPYAAIVAFITACCLSIEFLAPEHWGPSVVWFLLAPAGALIASAIPALVVARRVQRIEKMAHEKDDLIGLLLKDYAAERGDWVWSCDVDGRLRGVSQKFALHAGRASGQLEGTALADLLGEGETGRADPDGIAVLMRQRKPFYNVEARIVASDGEHRWRMAGKPVFRNSRFEGYVGTAANVTTESRAKETMAYLAFNDGLTGLSNRVHFQKRLGDCVARLDRYGSAFTLLYLDLDKFKAVNDTLGHQAGDQLLIEVAKRLSATVRKADVVARLGGDEFALLLTDESDPGSVGNLASRLIELVCMPYIIDGQELAIGVSIGVAIAPVDGNQADQLVRNADLALYRAKAEGGDCYCFFETTMDAEAHKRRELELELGAALERNEFALHYQPVVTAADSVLAGMEALIRWNHPTLGLVPAHEFMPLAERTGMIARIGEWTVNEACRALVQLPEHLTVAINLSTKHFRNADVFAVIQQALAASGVAPHRLELEVTESLLIDDSGDAISRLAELKKLGAMITLDHFGTGYSSLTGLLKFSFDKIKIDSSLVSDASDEAVSRETVRAIMALARTLRIAVATKGVETIEQAEFLKEAGSDQLQGQLFARPMALADILAVTGAPRQGAELVREMAEAAA